MPILAAETTRYPDSLFDAADCAIDASRAWYVLHVKPRQEKSLARQLRGNEIPFYLPVVARPTVVRGRVLKAHHPLFPGYLFLLAEPRERVTALATGRVVRPLEVANQRRLWHDLRQVQQLIDSEASITPQEQLVPGVVVEVTSGPLAGLRGKILRTAAGQRFVVEIDFIQ